MKNAIIVKYTEWIWWKLWKLRPWPECVCLSQSHIVWAFRWCVCVCVCSPPSSSMPKWRKNQPTTKYITKNKWKELQREWQAGKRLSHIHVCNRRTESKWNGKCDEMVKRRENCVCVCLLLFVCLFVHSLDGLIGTFDDLALKLSGCQRVEAHVQFVSHGMESISLDIAVSNFNLFIAYNFAIFQLMCKLTFCGAMKLTGK